MSKYNPDIHHRNSIRLKDYDYAREGAYFVTICCWNKECLFGEIGIGVGAGSKPALSPKPALNPKPAQMILNDTGRMIEDTWNDLPNHNVCIELDEFVIMPNHIHGIIVLAGLAGLEPVTSRAGLEPVTNRAGLEPVTNRAGLEPAPTGHNVMKMRHGLPEIIRQFKTFSAKRINKLRQTPGVPVWQRNYYEHIIRNEIELNKIREYIINNPFNWQDDEYCRGESMYSPKYEAQNDRKFISCV
ncbi:MAG: transposase [bacterium]